MKRIITALLLTLLSTAGWSEAYDCRYQGHPQSSVVLAREGQAFIKRFELNGILTYLVHQIAFENDEELRLIEASTLQGAQAYLNKETGAWMELHVTKTGQDGHIVADWLTRESHGYCSLLQE